MIANIRIKNYKSVHDHSLDLGRFNIFIGENGSGKTNLLEAIGMASASVAGKLDTEELYSRGVRLAKPGLTFNSFLNVRQGKQVGISFKLGTFDSDGPQLHAHSDIVRTIYTAEPNEIGARWLDKTPNVDETLTHIRDQLLQSQQRMRAMSKKLDSLKKRIERGALADAQMDELIAAQTHKVQAISEDVEQVTNRAYNRLLIEILRDYVIYNLNTPSLRGIAALSRREPLGIHGENLDVLLSSFEPSETERMLSVAKLITWLDSFFIDPDDSLKLKGHKLGRSTSRLYFRDRYMRRRANVFSAENANEGVLHVMFYLALFISSKTPRFFAIDNIETALNPRLCRRLVTELAKLTASSEKQVLITTHNPAVLDGLNLHDDTQRLFVVYRNGAGHTVTKRIKLKPKIAGDRVPLSELWMQGHLGGLPKQF